MDDPKAKPLKFKTKVKPVTKNHYNKTEWAGAFGDLGTLIPFVAGYLTVLKMDPLGILFTFGILLIITGLYYKTPIPIQPMKAIGGAAITQATLVTQPMLWGAGIFTGIFWLVIGLTGALNLISKITSKPVTRGIVLGLGLSFIIEGTKMMRTDIVVALIAMVITFKLLTNKHFPAMFALIVFGFIVALFKFPELTHQFASLHPDFRLPELKLNELTWSGFVKGALLLGIPQIPLTLGNAVIAVTAENNRLFPEHPITEKKMAISQGLLNLISPLFGGIPICHGAGGMAGHVRFGARTGGATVILGGFLLTTALGFSNSVLLLFKIFPTSVLGVILFFAGLELAVSTRDGGDKINDYYTLLATAGFSLWNIGIGFLAGIIMQECLKRNFFKVITDDEGRIQK